MVKVWTLARCRDIPSTALADSRCLVYKLIKDVKVQRLQMALMILSGFPSDERKAYLPA